jgi:glycosyltransferase involved in cell wall biosynthesis
MVGISLLTLVPGVFGGSATYASGLLRALERFGELEYRVFVPRIATMPTQMLPTKAVTAYPAAYSMPGRIAAMALAAVAPRRIRRQLELDSLSAMHFPLSVMLPRIERPPAASTLHDVLHLAAPHFLSRAERAYRRLVYTWSLSASRIVIVASEFARQTLVERAGLDSVRVRTIPLGVDTETFHPDGRAREPFVFYPADFYPHKNHARLLEAFELVRRRHSELELVMTGRDLPAVDARGVTVRGRVPTAELAELYRGASAMVFPSLHESFGLPPLEAMASGCPVASSGAGALPEVCGDAARYFDPESVEDMATAMADVVERPEGLAEAGLERIKHFTWERCATLHEEVYRELSATV